MPLINYIIFGQDTQKQNRRNTISYTRDEKQATLEEALDFYESLAKTLKWSEYFRLLKTLLFRLQRLTSKAQLQQVEGGAAVDEELNHQEKTVTKCICRVLNGFNFHGIKDAAEGFLLEGAKAQGEIENQDIALEFNSMLTTMVKPAVVDDPESEEEIEEEEK